MEVATIAYCTEQGNGQRAGAHAGFNNARTGENICHGDNLAGILRIDDRRATRHGQDEVREEGTQRLVLLPDVIADYRTINLADYFVVVQEPAVGMKSSPHLKRDGVHPATLVGELHPLAHAERPTAPGCPGWLRGRVSGWLVDACVRARDSACACLSRGGFAAHVVFLAPGRLRRHVLLPYGRRKSMVCFMDRHVTLPARASGAPAAPGFFTCYRCHYCLLAEQPGHGSVVVHHSVFATLQPRQILDQLLALGPFRDVRAGRQCMRYGGDRRRRYGLGRNRGGRARIHHSLGFSVRSADYDGGTPGRGYHQ